MPTEFDNDRDRRAYGLQARDREVISPRYLLPQRPVQPQVWEGPPTPEARATPRQKADIIDVADRGIPSFDNGRGATRDTGTSLLYLQVQVPPHSLAHAALGSSFRIPLWTTSIAEAATRWTTAVAMARSVIGHAVVDRVDITRPR